MPNGHGRRTRQQQHDDGGQPTATARSSTHLRSPPALRPPRRGPLPPAPCAPRPRGPPGRRCAASPGPAASRTPSAPPGTDGQPRGCPAGDCWVGIHMHVRTAWRAGRPGRKAGRRHDGRPCVSCRLTRGKRRQQWRRATASARVREAAAPGQRLLPLAACRHPNALPIPHLIGVGVPLLGQGVVGLLDVLVASAARDAQHIVVVPRLQRACAAAAAGAWVRGWTGAGWGGSATGLRLVQGQGHSVTGALPEEAWMNLDSGGCCRHDGPAGRGKAESAFATPWGLPGTAGSRPQSAAARMLIASPLWRQLQYKLQRGPAASVPEASALIGRRQPGQLYLASRAARNRCADCSARIVAVRCCLARPGPARPRSRPALAAVGWRLSTNTARRERGKSCCWEKLKQRG